MLLGQRAVRAVHPEQWGKNARQPPPARPTASVPPALLNLGAAALRTNSWLSVSPAVINSSGPLCPHHVDTCSSVCVSAVCRWATAEPTQTPPNPPAPGTALLSSLLTRSLLCLCFLNVGKLVINLLNAASVRLFRFPASRLLELSLCPAFLTHFSEGQCPCCLPPV